jgi:hypothetical protein
MFEKLDRSDWARLEAYVTDYAWDAAWEAALAAGAAPAAAAAMVAARQAGAGPRGAALAAAAVAAGEVADALDPLQLARLRAPLDGDPAPTARPRQRRSAGWMLARRCPLGAGVAALVAALR